MMHNLTPIVHNIVQRFFADKAPLNESIITAAQQKAMNEHMIQRLCELVNTETRLQFYRQPGVNQATALFEPADSARIIKIVIVKEPEEDMATDYMLPPQLATPKEPDIIIKVSSPMVKEASPMIKQEKHDIVMLRYSNFAESRTNFLKEASIYLRDGGVSLDINKMASHIDNQQMLSAILPHMEKVAFDIKDHINEDLKVTYVIGANPLVLKYKDCIMQGDKLKNSIVELEAVGGIVQKEAALPILSAPAAKIAQFFGPKIAPAAKINFRFFGPKIAPAAVTATRTPIARIFAPTAAAAVPKGFIRNNMGTLVIASGLGGLGIYGAHSSHGPAEKGERYAAASSTFDNPEAQSPFPKDQYAKDIEERGLVAANIQRMNKEWEKQRIAQINNKGNAASIQSRGIYDQARHDARSKT